MRHDGDPHSAKWWYGRVVEENPEIARYVDARKRLEGVTIDTILNQNWVKVVERVPVNDESESSSMGLLNLIWQCLGLALDRTHTGTFKAQSSTLNTVAGLWTR